MYNMYPMPELRNDKRQREHVINWMVVRHPDFVKGMKALKPANMDNGSLTTRVFKDANTLIANMQIGGPVRSEFPNYQYDAKNRLHHCHVTMGGNSYDVLWQVHEAQRLIYVLRIAPRENFDYTWGLSTKDSREHALGSMLASSTYKRIFTVENMVINPDLREMYEGFVLGRQAAPTKLDRSIRNWSAEEVKAHQRMADDRRRKPVVL